MQLDDNYYLEKNDIQRIHNKRSKIKKNELHNHRRAN